uniref:Uncharacterized protein n=1 Tax=Lactuca sativa TaxID=4236 RepID=A0A9R1XMK7_LACSA|nr:hypothetical protein LSAT_V11C200051710 [Lactuca sativa]
MTISQTLKKMISKFFMRMLRSPYKCDSSSHDYALSQKKINELESMLEREVKKREEIEANFDSEVKLREDMESRLLGKMNDLMKQFTGR